MSSELLAAALHHHEAGRAIIAVNKAKKPYLRGWTEHFMRPQSEDELREQFSNGAYGAAMVLWPASPFAVLDFDGEHAREAWARTEIELPETARMFTRSGGEHLYFRMPAAAPVFKRTVRIVHADCDCRNANGKTKPCGVDLLVRGYAVLPPTPGYTEDPDHPLEDAVLLPAAIIQVALDKQKEKSKTEGRRTGNAAGVVTAGERNVTACSLAGTMRKRGMSVEAIRAALKADNEQRFDPPLDDSEIDSILKQAQKWAPGGEIEHEHLTDMGNARRLVVLFGTSLRYCNQLGWFVWTGRRWEPDQNGAVERFAKSTVRAIYNEAAAADDKDLREKIATHAHRSENDARIKAMIALARTEGEVIVRQSELDADPWLLNVENGTLDLRTAELRLHRREDLLTKKIPIVFDPEATCPTWLVFLERVTAGNRDSIRFIQKAVGYSLAGSTREQVFFILYGTGANGKSTFIIVVSSLLGDYALQTRTETLMAKRGDAIPNDVARLAGARFVSAIETEGGRRLAESLVKQMTGGDRMTARFLHHEFFEFEPSFKLWLAVNHRPRIVGTDHAIWRRIRLIPFNTVIPETERDPRLADKLRAELPGILGWAVEGCALWLHEGLKSPEAVTVATAAYREDSDPLAAFLDDRCSVEPHAEVGKGELYKAFKEWAEQAGERQLSQKEFSQRISERGFAEDRTKKQRLWLGLRLDG
jgi:putative DNA primase/helicase